METFKIIPTSAKVKNKAVPPLLINNNGIPIIGKIPNMEAILINDCDAISITRPATNSLPKISTE